MTIDEIAIRSVELLSPKPGDVLVITLPRNIAGAQRERIAMAFKKFAGCEVATICEGTTLRLIRKDDEPPPPRLDDMGIQRVGLFGVEDVPPNLTPKPIQPGQSTML
jgi:hypothetical protein